MKTVLFSFLNAQVFDGLPMRGKSKDFHQNAAGKMGKSKEIVKRVCLIIAVLATLLAGPSSSFVFGITKP